MKTAETLRIMIAESREEYRAFAKETRNALKVIEGCYRDSLTANETPKETILKAMKILGSAEIVRDVIASLTIDQAWDGRISGAAKEWAYNSGNGWDEEACEMLWLRSSVIHCAHLSQLAEACGSILPKDLEEVTEEQPSEEITEEDLREAVAETISQAAEDEDEETVEKAVKAVDETRGYYKESILRKFLTALREAREAVKSGEDLALRVSDRNDKMGLIPSVSILPFMTCPAICRGTCGKSCYAAKLANLRPSVLSSWAHNTALVTLRPEVYWQQVREVLALSRFFRFHVGGDIINRAYLEQVISAAKDFPHCEILIFTKRYDLVNSWIDENGDLPENLHLHLSGWDGKRPPNPHHLPETNVYGRKEEPDPSWLLCGSHCETCACRGLGCWQSKKGDVIAFEKH